MSNFTTEYVTLGHPDRLADYLAALIIDDVNSTDQWKGHAAVEVMLTSDTVIFGGEVTTSINLSDEYLREKTAQAFKEAGYIPRQGWNADKEHPDYITFEDVLSGKYKIESHMTKQSPDIAKVTKSGSCFNDKGIFFGSFGKSSLAKKAKQYAQDIGDYLFKKSLTSNKLGSDIKVITTINEKTKKPQVKCFSIPRLSSSFRKHGVLADTGLTGRKTAVNIFDDGDIRTAKLNGGGSMVKPFNAADLLLNLYARDLAKYLSKRFYRGKNVTVALSCDIGDKLPTVDWVTVNGKCDDTAASLAEEKSEEATVAFLVEKYRLFEPGVFAKMVKSNFLEVSND